MENIATKLAGPIGRYPEADEAIEKMADELFDLGRTDALRAVRDVMIGLTRASVSGDISVADEHEWAALAVRANQMAAEAGREG